MQETDIKITRQKITSIAKEINISKDDLLDFLKSIDISASINTTLEADTVQKVYSHFKKDFEKENKKIEKVVKFAEEQKMISC